MKLSKKRLFLIISFFILLEPAYFRRIKSLSIFFETSKIIVGMIVFIKILPDILKKDKKIKLNKQYYPVFLMYLYMLLNTFIQNQMSISTFETIYTMIILSLIATKNIDNNKEELLYSLSFTTGIYLIINFITVLLFPKGLYAMHSMYDNDQLCWLLGYKNTMCRFVALSLGINLSYSYLNKGKIETKQYLLGIISIITVIKVGSATTLVAICLLYSSILFFNKIKIPKFINLFNIFVFYGIVTFLIYKFNIQEKFSFLIVDILHKNLTLTSRIFIWDNAISLITARPLFGYGILEQTVSQSLIKASHPHNFYLYHLFTGGIIGLLFLSNVMYKTSKILVKNSEKIICKLNLFVLVMILTMGVTESLTGMPLLYTEFILAIGLSNKDNWNKIECKKKNTEIILKGEKNNEET